MPVRLNVGNPATAGSLASLGESGRVGERIERVSESPGASEPHEDALKFILVAGPWGDHHHRADNGMLPLHGGAGGVSWCPATPAGVGRPETVNRNQVHMKQVRRLLPDALGVWRGHRPNTGVVIELPVAARLRGGSDITQLFRAQLPASVLAMRRWTAALSLAKSLLRKRRSLLVFSQVFA
jgi:hypothetical protein